MAKGFGGGGGMPNMQQLMAQAQKMQTNLKKVQDEAANEVATASAGGGAIEVVARGDNQIISVKLKPEIVDPSDIEMLQDLIVAASNEALKKVQALVQAQLKEVAGGMNVPGLF
jgi:nucleoid-associated protein EbfC